MIKKLLDSLEPRHYDLQLDIDRGKMTFTGQVTISATLLKAGDTVELHSKDLAIKSASIDDHQVEVSTQKHDVLTLKAAQKLDSGECSISLNFSGHISKDMQGMYPSYFEMDGQKKAIISTQFESHHAREVFPCIDEPAAKATFNLTLTTDTDEEVLSNTPVEKQSTESGRLVTRFETTPKMSTYLLAFACGELHCVEAKTKDGILVRSWATKAQPKNSLQHSLDEAVKILEFFTEYFDTPFPLKKCDQIALPDFDAGAMENWGLITYREVALLTDPDNRSIATEQYVSLVVAHELSHQWFGNLVTMQWWDDLWLNESFASIMEHVALDALHPDWQQWEGYTASDVVATSSRDIFKAVQPVRVDVNDPELIETLFDPAIVYAKGGRLIQMLREYLGDQTFRSGLRVYFKQYAYQNTTRDDLWAALSKVSGKDVAALMNPWLSQSGMPVVSIDQDDRQVSLKQERFVLDSKKDTSIWPIPLLSNPTLPLKDGLLTKPEEAVKLTDPSYVLLNQRGSGHYLTNYRSGPHRDWLGGRINSGQLPAEARIILFNDTILLSRRGDRSISDALDLAINNGAETRDNVWGLMGYAFASARMLVDGDRAASDKLKTILANLSRPHHKQLGWQAIKGETPNEAHLRVTMIANLLTDKDPATLTHARKLYDQYVSTPEKLPADLRASILASMVRYHDDTKTVVDTLLDQYHSTQSSELQLDICSALTATDKVSYAQRYFKEALAKDGFVRSRDLLRWLARLLGNHYTREATWDYLEASWSTTQKTLKRSKSYDYLPTYAGRLLTTDAWLTRYRAFFEPKLSDLALKRNITVALSDIEARVDWRRRDEAKILKWLESRS